MAYTITNSDNSRTITVQDTTVDTTYALKLIGRNVSGYGQYFVENTVRHLENFASTTSPSGEKLTGQLWYDKSESILKYWNGSTWKRATNIIVNSSAPSTSNTGDAWFDTGNQKLYIYNGTTYKPAAYSGEVTNEYSSDSSVGSPSNYGTKLRNIYLTDSGDICRAPAGALQISSVGGATTTTDGKETLMAVFSDHPEFVAGSTDSKSDGQNINYFTELGSTGGIGTTIKPGMNLRSEYAATAVALAERAYKADTAYKINLGNIGSPGSNIDAGSIITTLGSYIPTTDDAFTLGSASFKFAEMYSGTITIGDGSTGLISANGSVDLGTSSTRFANGYFTNIDVSGNVTFGAGTQNLGTSGAPVENFFTANASITSSLSLGSGGTAFTLPITDGSADQALITDGSGTVSFGNVALSTTTLTAGAGLTGGGDLSTNRTFDVGAGSYIIVNADSIEADATTAATANKLVARDGAGNVAANYFVGTATQAQYADLAEIYEADAEYEAGTVVKLGGEKEITQTSNHADPDVFGVISTNPAYLMNSDASGLPVALQGRVPVKVIGKIAKGERLVASDEPGMAWALGTDEYDARAIIGRSLQDKEDGGIGIVEAVIGAK